MKISKNHKMLILSHFYKRTLSGGGPPQEIRDYLLPIVDTISYIEHPFPYADDQRSSLTIYKQGKLQKQIFTPALRGPDFLFYILNPILTFYFFLRAPFKYDLCVALDNLNTVSVLPFKKLGIIKKLVFYTIDFTPKRFENKLLNLFYHLFDRIACYASDVIWVTSKRAIEGRIKNGINEKKSAPNIILPLGAKLDRISILPDNKIDRKQLVFVGILLEKQGLQLVLRALPDVIKKKSGVRLIIIGRGEYQSYLKNLTNSLGLSNFVQFKGFIEDHSVVEKILCRSAIGLATYQPSKDTYTYYGDPGKPKLYLGCGLPVIITDVPEIARTIKMKKAGLVVSYTVESIKNALLSLLSNESLYGTYRKNAIKLSKEFNTDTLIKKAFDQT